MAGTTDFAKRAARLIDDLPLPASPTFDDVTRAVSSRVRKPIAIRALRDSEWADVPATGLLIERDDSAVILTRESDRPLYRQHTALHELGHLLLPRSDCGLLDVLPLEVLDHSGMPGAIRRAESRGIAIGEAERQAEAIAFELAGRIQRPAVRHDLAFGL
jgi:hypothetical protein